MEWLEGLRGYEGSLAFCAAVWAMIGGCFLWYGIEGARRKTKHRNALRENAGCRSQGTETSRPNGNSPGAQGANSLNEKVIAYLELQSRKVALGKEGAIPFASLAKTPWITKNAKHAGLDGFVTEDGFASARIRLGLLGMAAGAVIGFIFSFEMALLLAVIGSVIGWSLPKRSVVQRGVFRAQEMEHHLPEMLDVMALGMRSGLSFDESLKMYSSHFKTMLSRELANAQRQWSSGLERRDEALRKVASSYDSPVFGRVVEMIIRSIRFGSSMVESLEAASTEARNGYKTRREEEAAKAPVKMMIPTGTLILPAMLIMVLGPVLLELAGGGF